MNKIKLIKAGLTPAFTMIELVFVIVVIGILSAIAIPRLAASRDDAVLVKGKSQIAAIRSGIAMQKSKRLLEGTSPFIPPKLDGVTTYNANDKRLFNFADGNGSNILEYPIYSRKDHDGFWVKSAANQYKFQLNSKKVQFDYSSGSGIFDCNKTTGATNADECKDLTR